jgi:phosphopantetheinyl transferase
MASKYNPKIRNHADELIAEGIDPVIAMQIAENHPTIQRTIKSSTLEELKEQGKERLHDHIRERQIMVYGMPAHLDLDPEYQRLQRLEQMNEDQ